MQKIVIRILKRRKEPIQVEALYFCLGVILVPASRDASGKFIRDAYYFRGEWEEVSGSSSERHHA